MPRRRKKVLVDGTVTKSQGRNSLDHCSTVTKIDLSQDNISDEAERLISIRSDELIDWLEKSSKEFPPDSKFTLSFCIVARFRRNKGQDELKLAENA